MFLLCLSFSFSLSPPSLSLSSTCSVLWSFIPPLSLARSLVHIHIACLSLSPMYPLLLLQPSPQRLPSQLRVPALPRSHSIHFSSPSSPTVHQFNRECLFLSCITFESFFSFSPTFSPSSSIIFYLSFADVLRSFSIFGSCRLLTLFLSSFYSSFSIDSACIPVSGSLPVLVKRHPRLSFVRTNLDLSSHSLFISFFLTSLSLSLSLSFSLSSAGYSFNLRSQDHSLPPWRSRGPSIEVSRFFLLPHLHLRTLHDSRVE